jgi:hypothetical protein
LSLFATGLQKLLRPKHPALDLYAAFQAEKYDPAIAERVIAAAGQLHHGADLKQSDEPRVRAAAGR